MPACPACGAENRPDARFCDACGAPLAAPAAGEERKVVSVLFVDLVGFTAASEAADPEDVRARLQGYHARAKAEVERFGGTVEKFVGDAVMAAFGAPVAHEDDAERAVRTGLELVAAVSALEPRPGVRLQVRVGIDTGLVVVGDLLEAGGGDEETVVGDTPNLAARLQAMAPPDGVVISANTHRLAGDLFACARLAGRT